MVEHGVSDGARLSMQPTRFGWAISLGWAFATRSGDFQSQLVSLRFPLIGLACSVEAPVEAIEEALERDNFMSPEEAQKFGIIDSIQEKRVEPKTEK